MAPNLNDPDGLVNLRNLAKEVKKIAPDDKSIPIVFGWGTPLFGAVNYFGGEIDIPTLLAKEGYTIIVASIAPISSNWERACELYSQLTCGKFSKADLKTNGIEENYDIDVDYGNNFAANCGPEQISTSNRRAAILYSNSSHFDAWKWDRNHKVHFICHSQGGNTVRYLISLMSKGEATLHPAYFKDTGRDDWTISVTTLGTPHRGTTFVDALQSFLQRKMGDAVGLVARLFATASYYPPEKRAYDLQLDHWGIRRKDGETFEKMLDRLESLKGPVWRWLTSGKNGLYDNSIKGVHELSQRTINTSTKVFYFSLSFHATDPFPTAWPAWGKDAFKSFPFRIGIPIFGWLMDSFANGLWAVLPAIVDFRAFVEWVTQKVITEILKVQGFYDLVLPNPGKYIPRKDVIPILLPSVYAMGSQRLTPDQKKLLGPNLKDWFQNDGVVNTASMPGPRGYVKNVDDVDFKIPVERGTYWHLGVNDIMDHADEVGVFISDKTADLMKRMYRDIADLISRLNQQAEKQG